MALSNQSKYYLSLAGIVIAFIGALHSINMLAGGANLGKGMVWLIVSVIVGFAAAISFYYNKSRRYSVKSQEQVAAETLAKLDKQKPPKDWHL